ncbi:MAG: sigma-70 family RNA polymerase sigma factor [Myxococcota bacterium]
MSNAGFQRAVQRHLGQGQLAEAATLAIERLGPEIFGFVRSLTRDESAASEVFSIFCEDLWRGLPGFRGEASFRTWAYTLARHANVRFQRDPFRRRQRSFDAYPQLLEVEERVRTSTLQHLKSEVRQAVTRLRERLDPDEQAILVLRIDRAMSFQDIAVVMSGGPLDDALRKTRAAALRKRVERIKGKLRTMAEAEGLMRTKE